jgi:hypothetical protein
MEKNQESSADHHSFTYQVSGVGGERRIMNDHSSILDDDGPSFLKVACGAPGIGAKM